MIDEEKNKLVDFITDEEESEIKPASLRAIMDLTVNEKEKLIRDLVAGVRKTSTGEVVLEIPLSEVDQGGDHDITKSKKKEMKAEEEKPAPPNPFIPELPIDDPEFPGSLDPPTANPFIPGTQTNGDTSGEKENPFILDAGAKVQGDRDWFAKRDDVTCLNVPGFGRVCGKVVEKKK